ncbi:hypothetical protein AOLI_G00075300 [Acnodon oligacanthus]
MDNLFRRRRLLKTLLSLTLVLGTLLTIQKFKVADSGVKELRWKPRDKWWKSAPHTNGSSSWDGEVSAVTRRPLATWSVEAANCSAGAPRALGKEWLRKLEPRFQQFVLHRHCRYFPMLLNHPEKCGGGVDVLLVVKSVIEEHERREAVRKTWGAERTVRGQRVKTLFLLGSPATGKDAKNLQKLLDYEDRLYGDILQWDFMDTFFNLTLKEVNFLRWFHIYCAHVPFVFKGDDDVFVNTENLVDLIGFRTEEGQSARAVSSGDTISKAISHQEQNEQVLHPQGDVRQALPALRRGEGGFPPLSAAGGWGKVPESHPGFKTFGIVKRESELHEQRALLLPPAHRGAQAERARPAEDCGSVVQDHKLTCAKKYSL